MKLFYLLALEGLNAKRRPAVKDECDFAHLPDLPHAEWTCTYDGVISDHQNPEECDSICNAGFVHDDSGRKTFTKCIYNTRKSIYQWAPKKYGNFAECVPDIAENCTDVPEAEDLTFFLLQNELRQGTDGYSDDDWPYPEIEAMFSGSIPIPIGFGPTDQWHIFVNFGEDVDISGVEFATVNSEVVAQTTKFLILRNREYNGDISDVRKIDVQGRSYDPTEAPKLEHYWNLECVDFPTPYENYCQFLNDEVRENCWPPLIPPSPECKKAIDMRNSICGEPDPVEEGSGASSVEGSGVSGL